MIIGAGTMGLLSAIYIKEMLKISDITFIEKDHARRKFAEELGFKVFSEYTHLAKKSVTLMIIAGGESLLMSDYIGLVKSGGEILIISYFDSPIELDFNVIVRNEIIIIGSFLSKRKIWSRLLNSLNMISIIT
ncbi:hypothetical protein P4S72_28550 [Vibrio sp. PP-XX7]